MLLFKVLLLGLILSDADGRFTIKSDNGSSFLLGTKEKLKLKLVADIIAARPGDNVVIIADVDNIERLSQLDVGMSHATLIHNGELSNQMVEKLMRGHLKDNKQSFYLLLPSDIDGDEKIKELILTIQNLDSYAEVAVVYPTPVDVNQLYEDKKIYNVYVFNPIYSLPRVNYLGDELDTILFKMFRICRFCSDGVDLLQLVNTWRFNPGFRKPIQFKRSFLGNFHRN